MFKDSPEVLRLLPLAADIWAAAGAAAALCVAAVGVHAAGAVATFLVAVAFFLSTARGLGGVHGWDQG